MNVKISYLLFFYLSTVFVFCKSNIKEDVKLKKYRFSFYLNVQFLDSMAYWRNSFSFLKVKMLDKFSYLERYCIGGSGSFKIARKFFYYVFLGFGIGACVDFRSVYSLLFLDVLPLGFIYNIDEYLSTGLQVGYSVWINPANACKDMFYINFKDVCINLNIFRYNNVVSFEFSKKVRFYSILKCRLESIFTTGWSISLFVDI